MPLSTTVAEPEQMFKDGMDGFDLHYSVLREHPEWVQLAKEQKKIVNVWTVNEEEVMREMIALGVDYITTDEPVLLQQVLKSKKK
jgi:glycerophosphoryl diester phosphodiesterase